MADFGSARSAMDPATREPAAAAAARQGAPAADGDQQSGLLGGLPRDDSGSDMEVEDYCEPDSDTGTSPEGGPQALEAAAAESARGNGAGARCGRGRAGSIPPRPRVRGGDGGVRAAAAASGLVAVPAPDGGYNPPLTSVVCTPCYRAPEVVMSRGGERYAGSAWVSRLRASRGKPSSPQVTPCPRPGHCRLFVSHRHVERGLRVRRAAAAGGAVGPSLHPTPAGAPGGEGAFGLGAPGSPALR